MYIVIAKHSTQPTIMASYVNLKQTLREQSVQ